MLNHKDIEDSGRLLNTQRRPDVVICGPPYSRNTMSSTNVLQK